MPGLLLVSRQPMRFLNAPGPDLFCDNKSLKVWSPSNRVMQDSMGLMLMVLLMPMVHGFGPNAQLQVKLP